MPEFLLLHYDWLRALHIIAVMSWMAGMLYLPRLFVYHAGAAKGSESSETFKIMGRRLLKIIMNRAMAGAWVFGGLMLWANPALLQAPWMHGKLAAVLIMTGLHHGLGMYVKKFARDANTRTQKFYRILNEIPAFLMAVIVILAVAEPF
ncbi:MAG: protoporphyrinogen oxidase HemJ [Alphaproteobacteria bacterium]|nr:protoporphyrinogen oxidase HemJ [Alphaproteobacteria bacterium]